MKNNLFFNELKCVDHNHLLSTICTKSSNQENILKLLCNQCLLQDKKEDYLDIMSLDEFFIQMDDYVDSSQIESQEEKESNIERQIEMEKINLIQIENTISNIQQLLQECSEKIEILSLGLSNSSKNFMKEITYQLLQCQSQENFDSVLNLLKLVTKNSTEVFPLKYQALKCDRFQIYQDLNNKIKIQQVFQTLKRKFQEFTNIEDKILNNEIVKSQFLFDQISNETILISAEYVGNKYIGGFSKKEKSKNDQMQILYYFYFTQIQNFKNITQIPVYIQEEDDLNLIKSLNQKEIVFVTGHILNIVDIDQRKLVYYFDTQKLIFSFEVLQENHLLVSYQKHQTINMYEINKESHQLKILKTFRDYEHNSIIYINQFMFTCSDRGDIQRMNLENEEFIALYQSDQKVNDICLSDDNKILFILENNLTISLIQCQNKGRLTDNDITRSLKTQIISSSSKLHQLFYFQLGLITENQYEGIQVYLFSKKRFVSILKQKCDLNFQLNSILQNDEQQGTLDFRNEHQMFLKQANLNLNQVYKQYIFISNILFEFKLIKNLLQKFSELNTERQPSLKIIVDK